MPTGRPPGDCKKSAIRSICRPVPVGLIRRGNYKVSGVDGDRPIGRRSHPGPARHDKEELSARVMVPVRHRARMKMDQSCVGFLIALCGMEHLQLHVSGEEAPVAAVPVTTGHDDHDWVPATNRFRIVPSPSMETSTTWLSLR